MQSQSQGEVSIQISSFFDQLNYKFEFLKDFWILLYVKYIFAEIKVDVSDISVHHLSNRGLFPC